MLVPGSWGRKLCLHQPFRKSSRVIQLEKKAKTFLATAPGTGQSCSTPSWKGVEGQGPKPWSFASINSSPLLL